MSTPGFPTELCEIRDTSHAGRGVFAKRRIPQGTHLHTSSSPTVWVINREYRREVCAECFAYDRGVVWKLRDNEQGMSTGVVWCSNQCKSSWMSRYGMLEGGTSDLRGRDYKTVEVEALAAVEGLVSKAKGWNNGDWDVVMLDSAAEVPSESDVRIAWEECEEIATLIRESRMAWLETNKLGLKTAQKALAEPPAPDILSFLLSAILASYRNPEDWQCLLNLAASPTPYASHSRLKQHMSAYLQLLAVLPSGLLDHVNATICLAAANRDAHNSFGLRSLDDGGSEMFGFGVWTSASFWNHSCRPNVAKLRRGRSWLFETSEDIEEGIELCITYMGGEENELGVAGRHQRLRDTWGFICTCAKCTNEESLSRMEG